ncbi:uncharacterized protein LOC134203410 [Armigeres subalbatus]|uniref:uncharacterized protein LOC134203410 n=1 Tax=Armigeres subalbatus TaxID=124917 RepID=UPI002ED0EC77
MNISFVKLGHEQCETCVCATLHQDTSGHKEEDRFIVECSVCRSHVEHMRLATISRSVYRNDGDEVCPKEIVLAVDLQKVIQLPRLEGLKTVVFTQRLISFNETFRRVGKYAKNFPVIACLWNESISGRSAADITSCFSKVILWCCTNEIEKHTKILNRISAKWFAENQSAIL